MISFLIFFSPLLLLPPSSLSPHSLKEKIQKKKYQDGDGWFHFKIVRSRKDSYNGI